LRVSREYELKKGQRLKIISKETGELCAAFRMYRLSEKCLDSMPLWDEGYMRSYLMNQYLEDIVIMQNPDEFQDITKIARDNGACVDRKYRGSNKLGAFIF
jgi:hypothetical protein